MRASTCYMCDEPATSREHVPPKCIFPDDAHLRKSKDDELLRHVLACAPANNDLALRVIESGVMPSWDRRPHILETFLPNLTPLKYGDYETVSLTIDVPRFVRPSHRSWAILRSYRSALRRLLVRAAQSILGPFGTHSASRDFGLRLAGQPCARAKKRAVVAVARKLAVLLLTLWKTQLPYQPFPGMA